MATNFPVHEKIWFDKLKYDNAERRFFEQMNKPVAQAPSSCLGASSGPSGDNNELVQELQQAISKLEAQVNVLEKTLQTQNVSLMSQVEPPTEKPAKPAEDDEDGDIDFLGKGPQICDNEEEDKEAYTEKNAEKPALPWDAETNMAQPEACGDSKLVSMGYGIEKLQVQCVVEDGKVGTDLLGEEITKFEEHMQSVDIAAFNKI
ncbi:hypothetical protein H8958_020789 [Nasalis larvatus]